MLRTIRPLSGLLPTAGLCLGILGSAGQAPAEAVNDICPVMPEEGVLDDMDIFVEHAGVTVALCCKRCRKEWLKDPEPFVAWLKDNGYLGTAAEESGEPATGSPDVAMPAGAAADPTAEPAPPAERVQPSAGVREDSSVVGPTGVPPAPSGLDAGSAGSAENARAEGLAPVPDAGGLGEGGGPLASLVDRAGRFHPIVVHFPVALLLGALLAHGLGAWRGAGRYAGAERFCLAFGAVGAVVAVVLGWASAASSGYPPSAQQDLFLHRWVGTATAVLAVLAWCSREGTARQRALLVTAAVGVAVAGHFGGNLIYGPGHLFGP